jgi:hypothetical protein
MSLKVIIITKSISWISSPRLSRKFSINTSILFLLRKGNYSFRLRIEFILIWCLRRRSSSSSSSSCCSCSAANIILLLTTHFAVINIVFHGYLSLLIVGLSSAFFSSILFFWVRIGEVRDLLFNSTGMLYGRCLWSIGSNERTNE